MKKFVAILLFPLVILGVYAATYTRQSARVLAWRSETAFNAAGAATAVHVETVLVQRMINDADATDIRGDNEHIHIRFNLLDPALSAVNINAAGKQVTYPQLAALMRQAALDRANALGVD